MILTRDRVERIVQDARTWGTDQKVGVYVNAEILSLAEEVAGNINQDYPRWQALDTAPRIEGHRILVLCVADGSMVVAEFEEFDEAENRKEAVDMGLWMVEGGCIDPDDKPLWTALPSPPAKE